MQVYNVGPDEEHPGNEYDEKFVWMVINYYNEGYEGYGEAVALGHDGMLYFKGLDHCSCYGPFEELENGQFEKVSVEDYLKSDSIHDTDTQNSKVRNKVIELLGERKMDDTKYILVYIENDPIEFFKEQNIYLGLAETTPSIEDAKLMTESEAEKTLGCMNDKTAWEIWSVKTSLALDQKYDKHLAKAKIKALEEEIEKLKKQL